MVLYGPNEINERLNPNIVKVLNWIDQNPGSTASACAQALGLPIETVYWAVLQSPGYHLIPTNDSEAVLMAQ
jgi:predicted transcriptional regulator